MTSDVATPPISGEFDARLSAEPTPNVRERPGLVRRSRWPLIVLLLVLAFGTWARLVDLGKADFWTDELYHVFAAEGLTRGEGPRLPSGEVYGRGIDITRLVAVARAHIDDPELAARLPSAIFGIAGLFAFAVIAWRIAGPWPTVWAVLLLAIFPVPLQEARNTRFYTLQLLHGLVAFYAGWRTLAPRGVSIEDDGGTAPTLRERWGWAALTAVAFVAGARVQPTTLSAAAGWGITVVLFAIADASRLGKQAIRQSIAVQLTLAGVAGAALVVVARPDLIRKTLSMAMYVPLWAEGTYSPRTYYWMLVNFTPLLLSLVPLVFVAVFRRSPALMTFLLMWFAVPFALHSFVFRFQTERYVLLALPALFLAAAIAAADGCRALFHMVSTKVQGLDLRVSPQLARLVAAGTVAMIAAFALFTTPAFSRAKRIATGDLEVRSETDWKRALEVLRSTPGADTLPWTSYQSVAAKYYWGRLDFLIERGLLDRAVGGPDTVGSRKVVVHPEGTRDFYLGLPVFWRSSALTEHFGAGRDVIVAFDSTVQPNPRGAILDDLRRDGAEELCKGQCGTVQLYRWTLPPADSTEGR